MCRLQIKIKQNKLWNFICAIFCLPPYFVNQSWILIGRMRRQQLQHEVRKITSSSQFEAIFDCKQLSIVQWQNYFTIIINVQAQSTTLQNTPHTFIHFIVSTAQNNDSKIYFQTAMEFVTQKDKDSLHSGLIIRWWLPLGFRVVKSSVSSPAQCGCWDCRSESMKTWG